MSTDLEHISEDVARLLVKNMHILVIEDDLYTAKVIKSLYTLYGYQCKFYDNGKAALKWIQNKAPSDIVLLDTNLPFNSGDYILRQIRSDEKWSNTPVIILGDRHQKKGSSSFFSAGADDFVLKPLDSSDLLARTCKAVITGHTHFALPVRKGAETNGG